MSATAKKPDTMNDMQGESMQFAAEISKVLHLMIHSLYTNRDIFLRELISNASDACDKLRFEALSNAELMGVDSELSITIASDKNAHTITITDNGIGMNRDDLITNLGTIAKSGTQEFAAALSGDKAKDANLIGQFGVGFYSAYMVADKVEVTTRKAGDNTAWRWQSDGQGSFTIDEVSNADIARGTAITLHIKEDCAEYLDYFRLQHIATTYSDHINFPIRMTKEGGDEETINSASALWARSRSEITDEQYQEFYQHVAHQPDEPWLTLHNTLEGRIEYTYLLYVPTMKPFDLFHPDRQRRVKLYVKRVFITDEGIDIIPQYLRFLRGIIDSTDLPLNISRETLQDNPLLDKIRESVTKKVLSELIKKGKKDKEGYEDFWQNFGAVLKEGLCEAIAPKEQLLDCCRFASTHSQEHTSLAGYKDRMQEGQEAIYYLNGDNIDVLRNSPQIEGFRKHGIEVLFFTDHVDDFWTQTTQNYGDIPFRSVLRAGEDLEKFAGDTEQKSDDDNDDKTDSDTDIATLIAYIKTTLGEAVRDVRTTTKLEDSPVCLAVDAGDMDIRMERFLLENNQLARGRAKILEINPNHPIITALAQKATAQKVGAAEEDTIFLLLDQANIIEGEPVLDASAFAKRMNALLG